MSRLPGSKKISSSPDLKVPHGDLEAGSECGILLDGADPLFRITGRNLVTWEHENRVGSSGGATDSPPQLVEVSQSEAVSPVNNDGVGVRNIYSAFDNGGGEENIRLPLNKGMHDLFKVFSPHLAMTDQDAGLRNQFLQSFSHHLNALDSIVQEKYLSFAFHFAANTVPDDPFIMGAYRSVDWNAIGRRSVDGGHVPHSHEGEVESTGNRGG